MAETPESRRHDPSPDREPTENEDPSATGTLVILMLFLMALAALWSLMYLLMLER